MASFERGEVLLTRFPFTDLTGDSIRPAVVVSPGLIGADLVLAAISSVVAAAPRRTISSCLPRILSMLKRACALPQSFVSISW